MIDLKLRFVRGCVITAFAALASHALAINAINGPTSTVGSDPGGVVPSALLAIDQNRATVIKRIVVEWGDELSRSGAGIGRDQLAAMLSKLRADQLLAASLVANLEGLHAVLTNALATANADARKAAAKTLGVPDTDLVYTAITPCRLFDTRVSQNGMGPLTPGGVPRTYSATAPVAQQGGPGGCFAPPGIAVAMIQLAALSPTGPGLLQGGASGTGPFANALMLYQPGQLSGSSIPMPVLVANGQFDLVAQVSGAEFAGDLLGYFRAPTDANLTYAGATGNVILVTSSNAANPNPAIEAHDAGPASAIYGVNTAATGSTTGVLGESSSTSHGIGATGGASGIVGRVTPTTPGGYSAGVRGINNGTGGTGIGVIGYQGGSGWGVYGETPSGFGVYGLTTNSTAVSSGVRGETFSSNGIGVEAKYSGAGVGVALEVDNGAIRVSGVNKAAFVHTATVANKLSANGTDVDNPLCNGDATAILIVTQKLNPSGIVYNNSPIGVYYNTIRNKWEIFNENNVAIPTNAQFNVLVIKQ